MAPVSVDQFYSHLHNAHSVEELHWILTGVEERGEKDTRDGLIKQILRTLFNSALGSLKVLNVYHPSELKGISTHF